MAKLNLEKAKTNGWKVGTVSEFLGLTPEEESFIEFKLILSKLIKTQRVQSKMTQIEFAKKLRSSQSRVAKMEAGDPSVGFDLLIKGLFATGLDSQGLGRILADPDLATKR